MKTFSSWELVNNEVSDENKQERNSIKLFKKKKEMHSHSVSISCSVALQHISESLLPKDHCGPCHLTAWNACGLKKISK